MQRTYHYVSTYIYKYIYIYCRNNARSEIITMTMTIRRRRRHAGRCSVLVRRGWKQRGLSGRPWGNGAAELRLLILDVGAEFAWSSMPMAAADWRSRGRFCGGGLTCWHRPVCNSGYRWEKKDNRKLASRVFIAGRKESDPGEFSSGEFGEAENLDRQEWQELPTGKILFTNKVFLIGKIS